MAAHQVTGHRQGGDHDAQLINFPTEPYDHDHPDRILLPWDTDELPVDVTQYLPKF